MRGRTILPAVNALLAGAIIILPVSAAAAPKTSNYSCKSDKVVDAPMQFVLDTTQMTAAHLHASAFGGADRSGVIKPTAWTLYDAANRQLDFFPQSVLAWTSSNMLKNVNLEGLVPGASYTLALTSQDWCGNLGVYRLSLTMPLTNAEATPPRVSDPTTVGVGLIGYSTRVINLAATDDTGVASVTVLIDGTVVSSFAYGDGTRFRWWFDDYPDDGTKSALEGPWYYVSYPDSYRGASHFVSVEVEDIYGNRTVTTAMLPL